MWKYLWSILTLKFITEIVNNKVEFLLVKKSFVRATFLYSMGTLFKLFLVFYAIYFIINNSGKESLFIYYVTFAEEVVAILLCCLIFWGNYLKLTKNGLSFDKKDT
jgi:hypothetical protein